MIRFAVLCLIFCFGAASQGFARPVSYPGGWTFITENDVDKNAALLHYTITPQHAVGFRHEYFRGSGDHADFIQHNMLLKRWNAPGSQANLYLKSGLGAAYGGGDTRAAGFTGLAADWENRRYFASYANRFLSAGSDNRYADHKARIGVAPYIGDAGDLHTWLMLEADYNPSKKDDFSVTPLVRFFKGTTMLEAGYNPDGGGLLNFTQRF